MSTDTRIYLSTDTDGNARLIEASHIAQAHRHLLATTYTVKAASAREVANLMKTGVEVEQVKATAQADLPTE